MAGHDDREALARELECARQELARFVYVASHDLRAPLRAIKSLAEWIAEDVGDGASDETREHLRLLRARVERMDDYLLALLEYSRIGRMPSPVERVDLRALLEELLGSIERPATMRIEIDADVEPFDTERAALERALQLLLENAVTHHDRPEGRIEVQVRREAGALAIQLSDDGPGIPPKHHEKALELFQTLKRRDDVGGCGMGLPIAKKIVESRGGSFTLFSEERGVTLRFTWPLALP